MKEIGLGLLGFGTVGSGVVAGLQDNGELLAERLGVRPVLRRIADLDVETDRGVAVDAGVLTTDAEAVIADPDVSVVIELIGGTGIAKDLVMKSLEAGKPVVTANKALLAAHGEAIFSLAEEKQVDVFFGASVGGGIPIIRALREGLVANQIDSMHGILNGTCNSILTGMEAEGLGFDEALAQAQEAGCAEADPALDIDGIDTAHKAVILASLAYGFYVPLDQVHVEGIRGLSRMDIDYALDMGYRIKLLAVIKRVGAEIEVRVHPTLVPLQHVLASVKGVFNAVMVHGDLAGDTLYYGRGAGREPTASTVIGDVADAIRNLVAKSPQRLPAVAISDGAVSVRKMEDVECRNYLRMSLLDSPGVFARITTVLGNHGISIASVLQKEEAEGDCVPAVIATHTAREKEINAALAEIDSLDVVGDKTVRLRVEG